MGHSPRTLIIHAGGRKTGSSALQNYLELNAARLEICGVDYKNHLGITHQYQITSGNGLLLYNTLISTLLPNNLDKIIESYFGNNNLAVCSSEFFAKLEQSKYEILYKSAQRLGIKIHIVFFIRDIASYVASHYDQRVKRLGVSTELITWSRQMPQSSFEFLRTIEKFKNKFNISVIHYDSNKTQIINKFIELLALKETPPLFTIDLQVNRSLSRTERELLLKLNAVFGEKYSTTVSDKMLYTMPNKEVDRQYSPEFLAYMQERFADEVVWINDNFFSSQPIVKIIDEKFLLESQSKPFADEGTQVHNLVLDWAFERISSLEQHISSLEQNIVSMKRENKVNALLRQLKSFLRPAKKILLQLWKKH